MKRMILVLTVVAFVAAGVQTTRADGGWCIAGKVLTGVAAGLVVGQALAPRPVYYTAPAPAYYAAPGYGYAYSYAAPAPPPVVYSAPAPVVYAAPAPVVVYPRPVYVARPAARFGYGYYRGCRPHYYRRGCW